MSSPVKVVAAPHTGITVSSLSSALEFFNGTLGIPVLRTSTLRPPISTVTGHLDAVINAAHLELPGGHVIELLEYVSPSDGQVYKPHSADVGSWHLCLTVENLDTTLEAVKKHGYELLAPEQIMEAGPNKGARVTYVRGKEDGITIEFWQRPNKVS